MNDRDSIKAFERDLDAAFEQLQIRHFDANESLDLAANLYEAAASKYGPDGLSANLKNGIQVLAPYLVSGRPGKKPTVESLIADLGFGSHYYTLRDCLYYSYNAPDSFTWTFSGNDVEIAFADKSIPRQFFIAYNNYVLGSSELFSNYEAGKKIEALLTGQPEGQLTPAVQEASALIEREADMKLAAYFSILSSNDPVDLGGYTYDDFLAVYRVILVKALYHRYFARANDAVGAIFMNRDELVGLLAQDAGRDDKICDRVLDDLIYDARAAANEEEALYFPLYQRDSPNGARVVMCPHHVAPWEAIVNLLRVVASRRSNVFLEQVSGVLGNKFLARVCAAFEVQGFLCHSNVSLRRFDPKLPDIDLAVISEEPTLGYVIILCEVKSPIPPRWAKDQLRVLNKDSIAKGFQQVEAIKQFLGTEQGVEIIRGLLPPGGHPHFDGFVVPIHHLVITSDNAGMFFQDRDQAIIDFRSLERLLACSDGDMLFIQHMLATYADEIDKIVVTTKVECQIGERQVRYESVTQSPVLNFPQVQWRSSAERQQMVDEFIAGGHHPLDVLGPLLEQASDQKSAATPDAANPILKSGGTASK